MRTEDPSALSTWPSMAIILEGTAAGWTVTDLERDTDIHVWIVEGGIGWA